MIFLTCAFQKPSLKYFISVIPLTILMEYDNIELWCKWCHHIHSFTLREEEGLVIESW